MDNKQKKSIRDFVLSAIESGRIEMRPKWHFIARAVLLITGIILVFLAVLYLISFIIFILRINGVWLASEIGLRGLPIIFMSLPWLLIIIAIFFIVVLELLVKKYSFSYRKPLLYTAVGIILLTVAGSFALAGTSLHRGFFRQAQENRLPFAGGFYRQYGHPPMANITIGTITETTPGGYKIQTQNDEDVSIIITPQTRVMPGVNFKQGEEVVVFGKTKNNSIEALGIRKITDEMKGMRFRMGNPMRRRI